MHRLQNTDVVELETISEGDITHKIKATLRWMSTQLKNIDYHRFWSMFFVKNLSKSRNDLPFSHIDVIF